MRRLCLDRPGDAVGGEDEILEAVAELEVLPINVQLCPDAMSVPPEIAGHKERTARSCSTCSVRR